MLGDNRDMSEDSRYWGYVAGEHIVGQAVAIWAHKAPGWALPTFARNGKIQ
jgi:signal peptidase I